MSFFNKFFFFNPFHLRARPFLLVCGSLYLECSTQRLSADNESRNVEHRRLRLVSGTNEKKKKKTFVNIMDSHRLNENAGYSDCFTAVKTSQKCHLSGERLLMPMLLQRLVRGQGLGWGRGSFLLYI